MKSALRRVMIAGYGHYVPEKVVTNRDIEGMMNTTEAFILSRTGVQERRHADPRQTLCDLIAPAALAAVREAGLRTEDLDMVIVNTLSPDYHDPAQACLVQARLGMRYVPAFDTRAQCSGLLYAIDIGSQFIMTGRCRSVLLICAEMLSKRLDHSDEGRNLSILLGDGAGAVVLAGAEEGDSQRGLIDIITKADGKHFELLHTAAPGVRSAAFLTAEDVRNGRHQFRMQGKAMACHASAMMSEVAREILGRNGLTIADIDIVVPHQPNLRILEEVQRRLEVARERFVITVDRLGNMASASLPVTLSMARAAGRLTPGALALLLAYGAGATWGAALYRC